jgi:hypothetical protein
MKHFRHVLGDINVGPLLAQIEAHPELWSLDTEWTRKKRGSAIYHEQNIVLRYLTLGMAEDRRLFLYEEDHDRDNWTRPAFHVLTEAAPIVFDVMRAVRGEHLGHVIITRLPSGGRIEPHIDQWHPAAGAPYWQRHQVPLRVAPDVIFRCGDEECDMRPGEAWWFDNQVEHSVVNYSGGNRISMIIDIRPFG